MKHAPRIVAAVVVLFVAATSLSLARTVSAQGAGVMAPQGVLQEGWAYVYAPEHQQRKTASGETFRHEELTGAHRTLPLGSVVRVTNLSTRRSTTIRINDRGPYIATRIIDLSAAAARAIGMSGGGTRVRLELTNGALTPDAQAAMSVDEAKRPMDEAMREDEDRGDIDRRRPTEFSLQLGSFSDEDAASRLARSGEGGWLYRIQVGETNFYRVNFGIFPSAVDAERALTTLESRGIRGFVKTVDEAERRTVIEN